MKEITVFFDGGCRPTNPGNRYGSFEVCVSDADPVKHTFELGWGTSNEAEFESLISALERAAIGVMNPSHYRVRIFTDSKILVNRVMGRNKSRGSEPQQRMFALNARVQKHLALFAGFTIAWQGRENNVARFGH